MNKKPRNCPVCKMGPFPYEKDYQRTYKCHSHYDEEDEFQQSSACKLICKLKQKLKNNQRII